LTSLVVGGLHKDNLEWASRQYEDAGHGLVRFESDADRYHWKAVYRKVNMLERNFWEDLSDRLSVSAYT